MGPYTPVILNVGAKKIRAQMTRGHRADDSSLYPPWSVCQKISEILELPNPVRVGECSNLYHHTLEGAAELDVVSSLTYKAVVIYLVGIPVVQVSREAANATRQKRETAANLNLCGGTTRERSKLGIRSGRIYRAQALIVVHHSMIKPEANRVPDRGRKGVRFLDDNHLPGS